MKCNSVLIVGHFGFRNNQLDGQTVKTRTLLGSFLKYFDTVDFFDVSKKSPWAPLVLLLKLLLTKEIVFIPGKNQLYLIAPLLVFMQLLFFKKIHYVVVGGWLPNLLVGSWYVRFIVGRFNSVSSELSSMVEKIKPFNSRSLLLLNYREDSKEVRLLPFNGKELKCVFFSRVMRSKGVFLAVDVFRNMIELGYEVTLDVYGPDCLNDDDRQEFESCLGDGFRYHGKVNPTEVVDVLSDYHILLFPTLYDGEGFPGCIVDGKMAGLPVIASNWKYNSEILSDGGGYVVVGDFVEFTVDRLKEFFLQPELMNALKISAYDTRKAYFESEVFSDWCSKIFNYER